VSVHNRILELAPDLARTLAQRGAWYFDRKVRSCHRRARGASVKTGVR
jgi:hypothetical protein